MQRHFRGIVLLFIALVFSLQFISQRSDCFKQSLSAADILLKLKFFPIYLIAAIAAILHG
ncbi:hypothetical protein HMPREF1596_03258 [Escherichia coli 907700]|uniref:Uncharacterized protein n=1 Tax=Serratia marcescens SM39 TaxID=1334564 RepID=A0AAT9DZ91_SERMA|nr:hypothetical protein HMPREF1596_03258 [Escherichia coli 907700]BAO34676.1 hypothetical protein SM39_2685 [Serratia marcescens SM39]